MENQDKPLYSTASIESHVFRQDPSIASKYIAANLEWSEEAMTRRSGIGRSGASVAVTNSPAQPKTALLLDKIIPLAPPSTQADHPAKALVTIRGC